MNNPYFEYLNSIKRDEIPEPEVEYIVVESKPTNEILTPKKEERNSRGEVILVY